MNPVMSHQEPGHQLRDRAEERLSTNEPDLIAREQSQSPEEKQKLLHELRVHQIELEMQNEELRKSQAELEKARERYFDLYDLAPVGYCTINKHGILVEANLTACSLFGLPRAELLQQPITRFILPDDQDIHYKHQKGLQERGEGQCYELRFRRGDGSEFWGHVLTTVVQGEFRVVISDISLRKKTENEKCILEGHLQQSVKMESVGRLAGGVAHDFNNMLSVILGHAEIILSRLSPANDIYEDVHEIQVAANRSAELVGQLLAFARKQNVAPVVVNMNKIIDHVLLMLRRLIGEAIAIEWKPGVDVWNIKIDPTQIDQVMTNLCANARDSIRDVGTIFIHTDNASFDEKYCAAHTDFMPGEFVKISVCDSGCGMNSETLELLFEPYYTTKKVGKGTGLGLAMVYGIVKQNEGFITVESTLNKGTTFNVFFPRCIEKMPVPKKTVMAPEKQEGITILIIEDEPSILTVTTRILERMGHRVFAASCPEEAIQLAGDNYDQIDLLLSDVVMPNMNGRDLAIQLKQMIPNLKTLFMSGYTADVISDHGVLDDGVHFIRKPFRGLDLAEKIREIVKGK